MKRAVVLVAFVVALPITAVAAPTLTPGLTPVLTPNAQPAAEGKATKDDYALDTSATASKVKVKGAAAFSLKIVPKNGKKVHADAPLEVTIVDNPAVKPEKQKLGRSDLKIKGAKDPEVLTLMHGVKSGATTLEVNVSFFLCTDTWCQRMSDQVQIPISVED